MEDNHFTTLWWSLPYTDMNQPRVHVTPFLYPHPHPSPPHPSGLSQSTGFGSLLHASNLHWSSALCMIIYMFQRYSLKSSHPCLLPQSPKVCSLHLHLLLPRIWDRCYHLSKFHYICANIQHWCFSFWLTSLCIIDSRFIHLIRTDSDVFLFIAE